MKRYTKYLFLAVLVGLVIAVWLNKQYLYDTVRLYGYDPPIEVIELADETTMLEDARRVFYVHKPQITDKEGFNQYCRDHGNEYSIVLGCYRQNGQIYLLDITDERLKGVKQVTAAHEFLHAAYDRLSKEERQEIDEKLRKLFESLDNERLKQTIEQYRKNDPSVVPNELHSIIGTEVRVLTPELEEYYAKYFSNRMAIVSFSEQYEQAFIDRRNQIRIFDEQLTSLRTQIDQLESSLSQTSAELQAQRATLDDLRSSGQIAAYNSQVPSFNSKVNRYNKDVDTLSGLIVQYNNIVQDRNAIAAEEAELIEAIDSREKVPEKQ